MSLKFSQPLFPCSSVCTPSYSWERALSGVWYHRVAVSNRELGSSRENADIRKVRGIFSSGERFLGSQTNVNRNTWSPARGSQRNVLSKVR